MIEFLDNVWIVWIIGAYGMIGALFGRRDKVTGSSSKHALTEGVGGPERGRPSIYIYPTPMSDQK